MFIPPMIVVMNKATDIDTCSGPDFSLFQICKEVQVDAKHPTF